MPVDHEIIRFNVLRNALYHSARRRSLEAKNRFFNFLVVILGTAAFGDIVSEGDTHAAWFGAAVAVIGALQLVYDFGRQARDHQTLQREYYHLLADIEGSLDCDAAQCAQWQGRMVRLTADEPPIMKALDARAYNDALDALEWPRDQRLRVPFLHRLLAEFLPFEGADYKKLCELDASRDVALNI